MHSTNAVYKPEQLHLGAQCTVQVIVVHCGEVVSGGGCTMISCTSVHSVQSSEEVGAP